MDRNSNLPPITDRATRKSLGDRLVEEKLITPEQMESARVIQQQQQGGRLGDILLKQGLVTPEQLAIVLSIHLNLPLIDLKRHVVQARALRLIPEDMARKHAIIPLDIVNDSLMVVMADLEDVRTIEDIKAQAVAEGMITGIRKAKEGITSISEVVRSVFSIT